MPQPEALILAGPNGAGKTTASAGILPAGIRFLNADLIAERLFADGHPRAGLDVAAGRLLLGQLGGSSQPKSLSAWRRTRLTVGTPSG